MFRESLLDSSPSRRNRKPWPMAAAFVLESMAAALIIIVPLLSTGVIPVSARVPRVAPLQAVRVASEPAPKTSGGRSTGNAATTNIVTLSTNHDTLHFGLARRIGTEERADISFPPGPGDNRAPDVSVCTDCQPIAPPAPKRVISHSMEALLLHRVEPVYPRTAVLINLQGEVRLHAIIAKNGTVQSLSVTSGHPILAQAALDAVRQWRYRPYVLNGEPVEVETLITVNFKRGR